MKVNDEFGPLIITSCTKKKFAIQMIAAKQILYDKSNENLYPSKRKVDPQAPSKYFSYY